MNRYPDRKIIRGASVEVRNGDVNGALRKLKKILDNNNRQKDLAKHEFYEKPSISRKRAKSMAKKRTQREHFDSITSGPYAKPASLAYMKSKRKRRVVIDRDFAATKAQRKS